MAKLARWLDRPSSPAQAARLLACVAIVLNLVNLAYAGLYRGLAMDNLREVGLILLMITLLDLPGRADATPAVRRVSAATLVFGLSGILLVLASYAFIRNAIGLNG